MIDYSIRYHFNGVIHALYLNDDNKYHIKIHGVDREIDRDMARIIYHTFQAGKEEKQDEIKNCLGVR